MRHVHDTPHFSLGAMARANAWPLALVGVGIGWLIFTGLTRNGAVSQARHRHHDDPMLDRASRTLEAARQGVRGAVDQVRESAGELSERAGEELGHVRELAHHYIGREHVSEAADLMRRYGQQAGRYGRQLGRQAGEAGRSVRELIEANPLAAAAIGLVIGAAIGASLPTSRIEDRWLGEGSDRLLNQARHAGSEAVSRAGSAARAGAEAIRSETTGPETS